MHKRSIANLLLSRLKEPRRFLQVLMGPRQTGKTTLVKQVLSEVDIPFAYHSADAVPGDGLAWLGGVWETARAVQRANRHPEFLLVVDEIQKIRGGTAAAPPSRLPSWRELSGVHAFSRSFPAPIPPPWPLPLPQYIVGLFQTCPLSATF